jgi:hypothetical protein
LGRQGGPRKAAQWRRRLARHGISGLPVTQFCAREGVSVSAFDYWRRWLQADAAPVDDRPKASAHDPFAPVEVVSTRSVTTRFAGGVVMEIPEDLLTTALRTLAEAQPC